ncbi:MAG: calcium-binding protein [Rhizobiaceae bacterium]
MISKMSIGLKTASTITVTLLTISASALMLHSSFPNLLCAQAKTQKSTTRSFGIGIAGYRGMTIGGEKDNGINGSDGGENILGGDGNDKIRALGGVDFINGEAGDDVLDAGPGTDIVMGGPGDDKIYGIDSFELIDGGEGEDTLYIPHKCKKHRIEDRGVYGKTLRSACGADSVNIKNVEHIAVLPGEPHGPYLPRKPRPGTF